MNAAATEEMVDMGSMVEDASNGENTYSITMKGLSNNTFDKGNAIASGKPLEPDRIVRLFMPCKPVSQKDWEKFVSGASNKEVIRVAKPDPQRPNVEDIRYYEKPVDGTYQLISTEYSSNKQNKDYNIVIQNLRDSRTISDSVYRSKLRSVDERIEDCVFPIVWMKTASSKELDAYLASSEALKLAANAQAEANSNYIACQKDQVEETEKQTKILQEQEQIVENWENTVSYANQNITAYYDYGDIYFYGTTTGDNNYARLTQMADLKSLINASDDAKETLKDVYKKKYQLSESVVNQQMEQGFEVLNFRDVPGFYDYYIRSFQQTTADGKELGIVIGTSEETFHNNLEEIYSWVTQYRDAKMNITSYKQSLRDAKSKLSSLKKTADTILKAKENAVNEAKAVLDKAVSTYKGAVETQATKAKMYETIKNSSGNRQLREKNYTWIIHDTDPKDTLHPNILFNLVTGVDLSKINPTKQSAPEITLCETGKFTDYWVITVPNPPLDIGYDTRLKIKTYETNIYDTSSFKASMATTVAGAFAYSLYPITEAQQGAIASIAADMTPAEKLIESTYS
jgi:hypothetical protein